MKVIKDTMVLLLIIVISVLLVKIVYAACAGTDTYNLIIKDPDNNEIQTCGLQTIDPEYGDTVPCDTETTTTCSDYVICQKVGNYVANISCFDCSDQQDGLHADTSDTTILTCYAPETNKFIIRNHTGKNVAAFDEKGYLYLKGGNYTGEASLSPPAGSFIVRDSAGTDVAYVDSSGNLYIKGTAQENQGTVSPPAGSFAIRNSTGEYVAYIDGSGNLALTGWLYENWLDPI